jgi:phosphoribosyl 1,2-cyclic phosphodiesterase
MVRFTVLSSGSRGNSCIVASSTTRVLVDAGLSCRELLRRMKQAGEESGRLDAILITHEHQDHVQGLAVTARRLGIPVYFTESTHRAWVRQMHPQRRITYAEWLRQYGQRNSPAVNADGSTGPASEQPAQHRPAEPQLSPVPNESPRSRESAPDPARLPAVQYFRAGEFFSIGDLNISPFTIPHDAADPVGFVFTAEGVRLALATDLGYIPPNVQAQLKRCDLIMLESNHDLEMLRDGPYPWSVKQRVLSRVGHLSNDAASTFLEQVYDGAAAHLILAHLSENNNHPDLARMAAERALASKPSLLSNRLHLACQDEPMSSICF